MSRIFPLVLSAAACLSLAANPTGRISGKVVDAAGKPIPSATILLKRSDISWNKTLKASSSGQYQQVGLEPREFDVTASAEGFMPQTVHLKIPLGETLTQDFRLLSVGNTATVQLSGAELFNQAVAFYNDRKYAEALPLTEAAYKSLKASCESLPAEKKPDLETQLTQVERVHGIILFEVGRKEEAEARLKAALARNAKDQRVLDCLISLSKAKGDNTGASAYQAALDALVGPRPDLAFNKGIDAYNKGDLAGAKPLFQQAIQADATFSEAYYMLAMCEFAENNLKATKRNFMKYLEVAPKGRRAEEVKAMLEDPSMKGVK